MNPDRHLHIIAFDIPYPPNYGGVIDVYYKIKALWQEGIKIHLHCFQYGSRKPHPQLLQYCAEVQYYRRHTGLRTFLSPKPYIIQSRISKALQERLLQDDYPILAEGIHSCAIVLNKGIKRQRIFLRPANVEQQYYSALAAKTTRIYKKIYYTEEARRLRKYELRYADVQAIMAVSDADAAFFKNHYPHKTVEAVYGFHSFEQVNISPGHGSYLLFHGNLSVAENRNTALMLIKHIAPHCKHPIIIAGKDPGLRLRRQASRQDRITLIINPSEEAMYQLISEAHIQLMLTTQATGFKLKLLNSLYHGRFVIASRAMLHGSGLHACVHRADSPREILQHIETLMSKPFTLSDIQQRRHCLGAKYDNRQKARRLIDIIFSKP